MKKIDDIVKFWSPLADKIDVNKYNTWLGTQKDLMLEVILRKAKRGLLILSAVILGMNKL